MVTNKSHQNSDYSNSKHSPQEPFSSGVTFFSHIHTLSCSDVGTQIPSLQGEVVHALVPENRWLVVCGVHGLWNSCKYQLA